jgi:hypothetical protein
VVGDMRSQNFMLYVKQCGQLFCAFFFKTSPTWLLYLTFSNLEKRYDKRVSDFNAQTLTCLFQCVNKFSKNIKTGCFAFSWFINKNEMINDTANCNL